MWLGQFNAKPTHTHFLAAKCVLWYLAGTLTLALGMGTPSPDIPAFERLLTKYGMFRC